MRHPTIQLPTRAEQALIRRKVKAQIKRRGSGLALARHLGITGSYLYQLKNGGATNPGNDVLKGLGLRRVTWIEER